MAETTQVAKGKRERSMHRFFINESDPEPTARAGLDVTHIVFKYGDDTETKVDLAKYFGGKLPPPSVGRAAAAFGINTSAGNAGNTAEGDEPADIRDAVEGRLEIFDAGQWSAERQGGGPRTSILLEAWIAYRKANNAPVGEANIADFREKAQDKDRVKKWLADADFRAIYEKIRFDKRMAKVGGEKATDLLA